MSPDTPNINTQPLLPAKKAKAVRPRKMWRDNFRSCSKTDSLHSTRKAAEDFEFHNEFVAASPVLVFDLTPESIDAVREKALTEVDKIMRRQDGPFSSDEFVSAVFDALGFLKRGQRKQPKRRGGGR